MFGAAVGFGFVATWVSAILILWRAGTFMRVGGGCVKFARAARLEETAARMVIRIPTVLVVGWVLALGWPTAMLAPFAWFTACPSQARPARPP